MRTFAALPLQKRIAALKERVLNFRLSIFAKLLLGFGTVIGLMIIISAVALMSQKQMQTQVNTVFDVYVRQTELARENESALIKAQNALLFYCCQR